MNGFRLAELERNVPNTAVTSFTIGSMSKQFTAFAVHLLTQDGTLWLDDDVRLRNVQFTVALGSP